MNTSMKLGSAGSLMLLASACGGSEESFDITEVAPIVNSATPTALRVSASAAIWNRFTIFGDLAQFVVPQSAQAAIPSSVSGSITAMFQGTFGKISGGQGTGYIQSLLEDLDSRMTEVETRFADAAPACLSNTAQDHTFDLGVHDDAKVTLPLQCSDVFAQSEGEQSKAGSGMVFGQSDTQAGLLLLLKHGTSSAEGGTDSSDMGFGYAATVSGVGTEGESVQVVFGQFNTATSPTQDQPMAARIYAQPSTNSFEMVLAGMSPSTGQPMAGGSASVGCGFYMVSDGTVIYAKGQTQASGMSCDGSGTAFEVCMSATDLSEQASTACDTLKAAQSNIHASDSTDTLASFDYQKFTPSTASASIFSGLKITSTDVSGKVTATSEVTAE